MSSPSRPIPFPYQQTHALTCLFASPYPTYQRKAFTTTSLRLAYKKCIGVCVRACTWFPSIKLDLSNGYQGYCIQGTVWANVSGVQGLFWLPVWQTQWWKVWRCGEDCMWALVQPESCWCSGNSALQSCREYRNGISIAFITAWQSFIKEGACQG